LDPNADRQDNYAQEAQHIQNHSRLVLLVEFDRQILAISLHSPQKILSDVGFVKKEKRPLTGLAEIMIGYKNA
jgi:hypothetical protein